MSKADLWWQTKPNANYRKTDWFRWIPFFVTLTGDRPEAGEQPSKRERRGNKDRRERESADSAIAKSPRSKTDRRHNPGD